MTDLMKMTAAASTVWQDGEWWPDEFSTDTYHWKKQSETVAESGEVQTAEYRDGEEWLIVYGE